MTRTGSRRGRTGKGASGLPKIQGGVTNLALMADWQRLGAL